MLKQMLRIRDVVASGHGALLLSAIVILVALHSVAGGQQTDADADAAKAFEKLVTSYRDRPGLGVKTTVTVELTQDGMTSEGDDVEAEFLFGGDRMAVVKLRGFTCLLSDGELIGVHEGNEHAYYRGPDEDSPYYALFTAFLDMPFPHLAIFLGEDAMADVYMQIHPIAPEIVPTAVEQVNIDGEVRQTLILASDNATLELLIDPESELIDSATLELTGGPLVQPGVTMRYSHTFEYETFDAPPPADRFVLDTKGRQRVTMLSTLPPPPQPMPMNPGDGPQPVAGNDLTGMPAPEFTLETIDGGAVDLAELRGQVVVIDFWATWCAPCVRGLPLLHDVARWARDEQLPVKVFAINTFEGATVREDTPENRRNKAAQFWEAKQFTLPVLMDYTDETAASYGVSGIPTSVVIRSDGVIHAMHTGLLPDYAEQLKRDISGAIEAVEAAP